MPAAFTSQSVLPIYRREYGILDGLITKGYILIELEFRILASFVDLSKRALTGSLTDSLNFELAKEFQA